MFFPVAEVALHPLVPPAIGFTVGVLSGLFGVGGGFLVTPILIWIGVPPVRAVGSELNQIVAASSSGTLLNARLGNVSTRLGLLVAAGGLPAALGGTLAVHVLLSRGAFDTVLKILYTFLLLAIGLRMALEFRGGGKPSPSPDARGEFLLTRRVAAGAVGLGVAAGLLSAFLGVGGGIILVPAMIYFLGCPTRLAIGTSLFQVLLISFGTTVFHAVINKDVDVVLAALLMTGSVPGSWLGVWLGVRLPARSLRGLLGVVVLLAAARMIWGLAMGGEAGAALETGAGAAPGSFLSGVREFALDHPALYGLSAVIFALAVGGILGALVAARMKSPRPAGS